MSDTKTEKGESQSNGILIWLIVAYISITGGMLLLTNDPSTKQTVIWSILWLSGVLVANINKIIENATNVEIERKNRIIRKQEEEMREEKERAKMDMAAKQMEVTWLTEKFEEERASADEEMFAVESDAALPDVMSSTGDMPAPCAPGKISFGAEMWKEKSRKECDDKEMLDGNAHFKKSAEGIRWLEDLRRAFDAKFHPDRLIGYSNGGYMRLIPSHVSKSYVAYKNENNRNVLHLWENEINFSIPAFSLDANEVRELIEISHGEAFPKDGIPSVVRFKFGKGGWEKHEREIQQFVQNGADYLSRKATKSA